MSNPEKFQELLDNYVADGAGVPERNELFGMLRSGMYRQGLEQHIKSSFGLKHIEGPSLSTDQKEEILRNIFVEERLDIPVVRMYGKKRPIKHWTVAAIAIIIVTVVAGIYIWPHRSVGPEAMAKENKPQPASNLLLPGSYKATLTLADGKDVVLDDTQSGDLPLQGATRVSSINGQELLYSQQNNNGTTELLYNKIATPRGGQYRVVLPDGSKVWLNAASTLRFPIAFAGNERHVQLTGEAYFEIKSLPAPGGKQKIPFMVEVNGIKVAVLGTHFNVMAYSDEQAVKTTLLEGAVEISKDGISRLLKPGQEALANPAGIRVVKANLEQAIAWKDGFFDFEGVDVQGVLRQVARWYDVSVENGQALPAREFGGKISRNAPMTDILKVLEANNVHVRVEPQHRKIIIIN